MPVIVSVQSLLLQTQKQKWKKKRKLNLIGGKGVVIFNVGYYGGRNFCGLKKVFEPWKHLAKRFGTPT